MPVNPMSANPPSDLSLDYLLARVWKRRLLVLVFGVLGGLLLLGLMYASPKYQMEMEVKPPAWGALASLNQTGLVLFKRSEIFDQFLHTAVSKSTGVFVWEQVLKKGAPGLPRSGSLPVSAEVIGGFPKAESLGAPQRILVTGPSGDDVIAFMNESLKAARRLVLEDMNLRLQAAVTLQLSRVNHGIEFLRSASSEGFEKQRLNDRQAALQGGGFEEVPLAYLGLDELLLEQQFLQNFTLPTDLDVTAQLNLEEARPPWDWYSKMHPVAGLLVGLLVGAWLAVAWRPGAPAASSLRS